ncbi:Armadillo repeat-containing protein 3 [Phlyctochytrium planicorne]|nr:Armadillo repeat-containing protein 3 [Phlyctochytrium planicorne]
MAEMQCEPTTFVVSDTRTLIVLLGSPEIPICVAAIEALTKYAEGSSKHRTQLLNLGMIKSLMALSSSKEIQIKKAAVACIAACTELSELHPEMRRKDLIDTLILLTVPEEAPEVQDEAAFALASMAKDFSNKSEIRKAGGVKALVKLLESADPDVKKNSALAISVLLEDCEDVNGAQLTLILIVTNRSEIRYVNGLAPLLELLGSEFPEVQENALLCLIQCAEDCGFSQNVKALIKSSVANRVEIRKLNGVKRLIDLLCQEPPELSHQILLCISNCLEENETNNMLYDLGGLAQIVKMLSAEDIRSKRNACLAVSKAGKSDRNQSYLRDLGALPLLFTSLNSADPSIASHAAMAIASVAKNDINLNDLHKMGAVDTLAKLLTSDDTELCRQSTLALSCLCLHVKVRTKLRSSDTIQQIVKILGGEDGQTLMNAADCLANLAEDCKSPKVFEKYPSELSQAAGRVEIIKHGGVAGLIGLLQKSDTKILSSASVALARIMQEADGRVLLSKDKKIDAIPRLISLVSSKDVSTARNAAYALSTAAQLETNALCACQNGAIEALLQLARDPLKCASKFAMDALDKLLNYNLSAKYWLKNELSLENTVKDGFYDYGSAGFGNIEPVKPFHTLADLRLSPVDTRREVLLVDFEADPILSSLAQSITTSIIGMPRVQQIQHIANTVCTHMGGPVNPAVVGEFSHKFKITELKLRQGSNVLPLGLINVGTFYHRALLFKVICDKIGLGPCSLVRGEYKRGWNVIDFKRFGQVVQPGATNPPSKAQTPPAGPQNRKPSAIRSTLNSREGGAENGLVVNKIENRGLSLLEAALDAGNEPVVEEPTFDEPVIVDLMFEPGRLLLFSSDEAIKYRTA